MKKFLKYSWPIIIACFALTVLLAAPLASIVIESSTRIYMPKHSDSYKRLLEAEDQFGSMISVGISLETNGETILTPEYIEVMRKITEEIENLDKIDSVDSLTNIDFVYSLDGGLAAGSMVDDEYTGSSADMKTIKNKIVDWQEMYNRVIVSDNFKASQIVATLKSSWLDDAGEKVTLGAKEQLDTLYKIEDIAKEAVKGHDLEVRFYGEPVVSDNMKTYMMRDLLVLVPLVALVVLVSLYFSFHTIQGTLLPLIAVLMATVWTCGIMAILNVTFTIIASVIPIALIACGSAYGIHVINHYNAALANVTGEMTKEKHLDAIVEGIKDVWSAVLLAGITTVAGFISLVTSPMGPLRSFAVFTALGIVFSLLLSVTFIPAMLYVTPVKRIGKKLSMGISSKLKRKLAREIVRRGGKTEAEANGTTLYNIYHFFTGTKVRLTIFGFVIVVFSAWGVSKLVIDTSIVNYFPPACKFRQDINYVNDNFSGTNSVYFVVSGQEKGDLTKPEILKAVDNLQVHLQQRHPEEIGKIVSFTTFVKRMNQVMHVPMMGADATYSTPVSSSSSESYASDDWGDSGDEWGDSGDDWGDGADSSAEAAEEPAMKENWVDPNIAFAEKLESKITVQEALEMFANAYTAAGGKNATVEGMVSELEKSLNYNGLAYYEIPYDLEKYPSATRAGLANLVSQYLLLYSGSLDRFSDDQLSPKSVRMQVQLRSNSTVDTAEVIKTAKSYATKYFPEGYSIEATGNGEMEMAMSDMVIKSQMTSILFSMLLVFIILSVAFKSPIAGILGVIPLTFTIILNFMVMGFSGIRLDLVTSLIASVAVGVGIDFTIHFMESYRIMRQQSDDVETVTLRTFAISGRGIVTNALAVGLGFAVLMLSGFDVLRFIGILAVTVMFSSSFLAMTVIPGFLNAFDPKFMQSKEERERNAAEDKANLINK